MKTIREVVRSKKIQTVYLVTPQTEVATAARLMADRNVGALVVLEEGRVVGVISERDLARKLVAAERPAKGVTVGELMSAPALCARPEQTTDECMVVMTEGRVRHLPVVEDGRLIALVSIGDLVKDVVSDQAFVIDQLEGYISGRPMN